LLHFDSINFLNRGGDKKLKALLARHYEISHHVVSDDDFLNIYSSERFQ
jgi:hypothetical protein